MPRKFALLMCDTPMPEVLKLYGNYRDVYENLLQKSLEYVQSQSSSPLPKELVDFTLDGFDVVTKQEVPADNDLAEGGYEAIFVSGSAHSACDDEKYPWVPKVIKFLRHVGDNFPKIKIIAICFGQQLLARAYGGQCVGNPAGWEISTTPITLTDNAKYFETLPSSLETLQIQSMHRDHVPEIPPEGNFYHLAYTERGPIQAFFNLNEDGKVHILCFQGHPEFTPEIVSIMVAKRTASGIFNPVEAAEAAENVKKQDEGRTLIGQTIWEVLGVTAN